MPYCHHCGRKVEKEDSFCEHCGKKLGGLTEKTKEKIEDIKEEVEDLREEAEKTVEKTSHGGLVVFIILLIIIGYIFLDIWAISQLTPVVTLSSIFNSISNFNADISLTQTSASSTIRIENPTFVPIIFARIAYDANYGNSRIAEGKTGFFVIGPHSQQDVPVDLTIHNLDVVSAGLKGLWNTITGKQERKYVNMYADIGITKFKIGTLE